MTNAPEKKDYRYYDAPLGLFTGIGVLLTLGAWMWFKNIDIMHQPQHFNVMFHNSSGLQENAAVYVDGVRVGSVEKVTLQGKHKVEVGVKITNEHLRIPEGSQVTILMNGLVGARYVEIELPDLAPGEHRPPLGPDSVVQGIDPVRAELIVNKLASELDQVDLTGMDKSLRTGLSKLSNAADHMSTLATKLEPAVDRATGLEDKLSVLATDLHGTTKRVNRLMDDPKYGKDLKETIKTAEATVAQLQETMKDVDDMLGDKELRSDVLSALHQLNDSTSHVDNAMKAISTLSRDAKLREDAKEILGRANDTMTKVNQLVSQPAFGTDLKQTLHNTRDAIQDLDVVAKQMQNILDKKHPLLHLIFGRPGARTAQKSQNVDTH